MIAAHERAVAEALQELETFACRQDGQGINKRHVPTGQLAGAIFRHGESRALDPHLHSHVFLFNVTADRNQPNRLVALESSPIFERARYLTEVYRHVLAREVQSLGYEIERRDHGFELSGVPQPLLERFSKRAKERDRVIAAYTLLSATGHLDVKTLALNTPDYLPEVHYHQVRDAWHGLRTPSGR